MKITIETSNLEGFLNILIEYDNEGTFARQVVPIEDVPSVLNDLLEIFF